MPFNLLKIYDALLDIRSLTDVEKKKTLRRVFDRDITNNSNFSFKGKRIYPIKTDGEVDLDRVFSHLICSGEERIENGQSFNTRVNIDLDRSERLHWIRTHIDEAVNDCSIQVFSITERNTKKRKDIIRTYIYNQAQKYVIVLEPLNRCGNAYYLLSAYYLNKNFGEKMMEAKMGKKMSEVL